MEPLNDGCCPKKHALVAGSSPRPWPPAGRLASESGIALVLALIMSLAIMAMAAGVLYFVNQSTHISGAGKNYTTASGAADGAVNLMKDVINLTLRADPDLATVLPQVKDPTACITTAAAVLNNDVWHEGNPCLTTVNMGNGFTANVSLAHLYKLGLGTLEFASSTGTGTSASFYKISVQVTGPNNASADSSMLYRFIN